MPWNQSAKLTFNIFFIILSPFFTSMPRGVQSEMKPGLWVTTFVDFTYFRFPLFMHCKYCFKTLNDRVGSGRVTGQKTKILTLQVSSLGPAAAAVLFSHHLGHYIHQCGGKIPDGLVSPCMPSAFNISNAPTAPAPTILYSVRYISSYPAR